MTAKCEVLKLGQGYNVRVSTGKPDGDEAAALPWTLGLGDEINYYTLSDEDSYVHVSGNEKEKGCWVNGKLLGVGESRVIGNLKITGA